MDRLIAPLVPFAERRIINMKKIIVVFGASGDTGKYVVGYLKENCDSEIYDIVAVGTRDTTYFDDLHISYYHVDIRMSQQFSVLPDNIFAVVDLAGLMPARMKGYCPQRYIDVNITGMLNILEYCRKTKCDRILFAQSFGDIKDYAEKNIVLAADLTPKFSYTSDHTIYIISKNTAIELIENYHQQYGIKKFIFRLPTIYLWSDNDKYYVDGIERKIGYRILIEHALKGEQLEVWGDPTRKKDMIYVKDFAQMLYNALLTKRISGYYNVGTGIGTTLDEQIQGIAKVFNPKNKRSEIIYCPERPNSPQYIMDIQLARDELGYSPKYNYIDMLIDMKAEMLKRGK